MTGIFGYRPAPFLFLPDWLNFLTPPELYATAYWFLFAVVIRNQSLITSAALIFLGLVSLVKYFYALPRNWRPPITAGPI